MCPEFTLPSSLISPRSIDTYQTSNRTRSRFRKTNLSPLRKVAARLVTSRTRFMILWPQTDDASSFFPSPPPFIFKFSRPGRDVFLLYICVLFKSFFSERQPSSIHVCTYRTTISPRVEGRLVNTNDSLTRPFSSSHHLSFSIFEAASASKSNNNTAKLQFFKFETPS